MSEINFTPEASMPEQQPEVFPVDATKAKSLEEIGVLFNALGIAMTKEYAKERGLEHLLATE